MNLFKVLASGKRRFSEELSSAMLAWLLSPNLEHGLGTTFVEKFLSSVGASIEAPDVQERITGLLDGLAPVLRTDGLNSSTEFQMILEMPMETDYIDLVVRMDNWWFAIENKIHDASVNRSKLQLRQQYRQLRAYLNDKCDLSQHIVSVFLVPKATSKEKAAVLEELDGLKDMGPGDYNALLSWRSPEQTYDESESGEPSRSILGILRQILQEESHAELEPLSDYLRHTLKAFAVFIESGFKGYPYDRETSKGGFNDLTTDEFSFEKIEEEAAKPGSDGDRVKYVGIQGAARGILRTTGDALAKRSYQVSTNDMSNARNWLEIHEFLSLAYWRMGKAAPPEISWEGSFSTMQAYRLAQAYGDDVYVRNQGGAQSLTEKDPEEIRRRNSWELANEQLTRNWIPGTEFVKILHSKGVHYAE